MNKIGYFFCFFLCLMHPFYSFSQAIDDNSKISTSFNSHNQFQINNYLVSYVSSGDYEHVSFLLIKGANPNYCFPVDYLETYHHSVLMAAASKGFYNIAELLISKGANINYQSEDGSTALIEASLYNHYDVVELLLKKGADVNLKTIYGFTALFQSVLNLNDSITDLLIKNNALVNITDGSNCTPLYYSCGFSILNSELEGEKHLSLDTFIYHSNANKISELLINAGADINITDSYGYTPLMVAAQQNNLPLVKILCKARANVNAISSDGISSLMFASDNGFYQIAKILVDYGANANYSPDDGNTALFAAVRANNDSIAELLLQKKALVNIKNSMGLSPLHFASGYGYPFMANLLIASGASVDITDYYGNTPLITSVYSGAKEVTQILIDAGADLNLKDNKGNTPLMIAAQFNDTLLIKKLSLAGARLDEINKKKHNALSIALENNAVEAFKMLVDFGAKTDSTGGKSYYQQAVEEGNSDISLFLKEKGLKTRLYPNVSGVTFYSGFSSSQSDFMVDMGFGVFEPITQMLVNIGYKYRPYASHVLEYHNSSFYQYWEKRYSFYLSLQHYFMLKKNYLKGNVGFIPGLSNEFSWRYYRGVSEGSGLKWFLVPSVGLFYQKNLVTIIGKWERIKYNSQITSANRFNLQILMTIPTRKRVANKQIDWLD